MHETAVNEVREALNLMIEAEHAIEKFYSACAACFPENRQFWQGLGKEESAHAALLMGMVQALRKKPEAFSIGKLSPLTAIQTAVGRVYASLAKLNAGSLTEKNALLFAYEFESTTLEREYWEVIQTTNPDLRAAFLKLREAGGDHRDQIRNQMQGTTKPENG